jgi:hypothetical protein
MSALVALDPRRHAAMRFDPAAAAAGAGAGQRIAQLGLSELALAAADMPLCLAKEAQTGRFNPVALMGLAAPRNLFVAGGRFHATYLPRALLLGAFRLDPAGAGGLAVDEAEPALRGDGTTLIAAGATTALVDEVRGGLERLVADVAAARALADALAAHRLLRPLGLTLRLDDGAEHRLDGLYTIDEDALHALDEAAVVTLHRGGQLAAAAVIAASLAQLERLRQLHDASGAGARIAALHVAADELA